MLAAAPWRVIDNMGGTAAGVLSGWTTVGQVGGAQTHTLTTHELASHAHSDTGHGHILSQFGHSHGSDTGGGVAFVTQVTGAAFWQMVGGAGGPNALYVNYSTAAANANVTIANGTANISANGGSGAHNNVQPTVVVNIAVKL